MSNQRVNVACLLIELEQALREMNLWREGRPSPEALASKQPFCVDTLEFNEWLQFVFVERINELLKFGIELPQVCEISPYAEEYFRGKTINTVKLRNCLKSLDEEISQGSVVC